MKTVKKLVAIFLAVLMSLSCFSIISFAEEATEHLTEIPEGYVGVYTIEDLYCIRNDLKANYILMNDIDLSEATAEGGDWNYGGRGWNPIGSEDVYGGQAFSGVFNGNGYMVKGLNISIKSTVPSGTANLYLGLFSNVSGTIKNLVVSGTVSSEKLLKTYIGGIAGYCTSTAVFENCTNLVDVYCYNTAAIYAGGIVGFNNGSIYRCCNLGKIEISGSNASELVSGRTYRGNSFAAGIAGKTNQSESIISQCINAGEIIAVSRGGSERWESGGYYLNPQIYYYYYYADVHASGITSGENGNVIHCYNIGNISATKIEGASYASLNAAGISYDSKVTECYNIASSTGYSVGKTATKSYCPEGSGTLATGVISLTAGQMKLKSMYSGWDFDSVWTMEGRDDYYYPELRDVRLLMTKDEANHKHEYITEVTTPATHTATGVMTYTCSCGDTYTETIDKITEHKYDSVVTAPTCTEQGYTTYTCECGDSYVDDYVDETGHSYTSKVTTPATHTATGVMTYTCHCGDTYTETIDKIAEHNYNAVVTAPTCEDKGYTTYTCECGDSYVADYVDAKGHTAGEWIVTKPATSTQSGTKTQSCTVCGTVLDTQTIPAYGKVNSVSVSNVSLDYKSSTTLNPQISADAGVKYTVAYSSSNPSVASVDANGKVSTGKTGSATITVTVTDEYGNTVKDTCEVKVSYNWWQWIIVIVLFGWIWY